MIRGLAGGVAGVAMLGVALAPLAARAEHVVVDMAGRSVALPDHIGSVVTIGPVPVINSFVFAFGRGSAIANGLPPNFRASRRWKYQDVFDPGLSAKPAVQSSDGGPLLEDIVGLAPDVVLTMSKDTADSLARVGVPAVYLAWRAPDDVKTVMSLLGELFGQAPVAKAYDDYFDRVIGQVERRVSAVRPESRPRVLYCNLDRLTQPHLIAEWWIAKAGGLSVTDDGRATESRTFSLEQLLAWNPEVLIVGDPREIAMAYGDPRFATISAVRNRRVFAAPNGAHLWANRTIEQPLTVLWAAKLFHPALFAEIDMRREVADFYATFFHAGLTPQQVDDVLAGTPQP